LAQLRGFGVVETGGDCGLLICRNNTRMPMNCASHNVRPLVRSFSAAEIGLSRRSFARLTVLGMLLSILLPEAAPAQSPPESLIRHRGWVLRADDLQRLGIK
jgi:hypothetical protein